MNGMQVPLVMVPRFTSYFGARNFVSAAIEVSKYFIGNLTIWRGVLQGTGDPTFKLFLEFSATADDIVGSWTEFPLELPDNGADPGQDTAQTYGFGVIKRWMRVRVELTGTNPEVTCWAAGLLAERTDG